MMDIHELIQAAHLDALGLLDEADREAFEAAFARLPPELKAQLRAEQSRVVLGEPWSVRAEDVASMLPPPALKARVLDFWRSQLGAPARRAAHGAGRSVPPMRASRGVSPMWRAVALGSATAALVLSAAVVHVMALNRSLNRDATNNRIFDEIAEGVGRRHLADILFRAETRRAFFIPAEQGVRALASLHYTEDWAHLYCYNLPSASGEVYKLGTATEDGLLAKTISTFESSGPMTIQDVKVAQADVAKLALFVVQKGETRLIMKVSRLG